jgi:hypothetical protein
VESDLVILSAPKIAEISQATNPKLAIMKAAGDLSDVTVGSDLVLLGTYIRPEKTIGGIIRPKENVDEDEHQGKVGLVLKAGPIAYGDWEDPAERGIMADEHAWVMYAIKDALPFQLNGTPCRLIPYDKIRMRIPDPTMVF